MRNKGAKNIEQKQLLAYANKIKQSYFMAESRQCFLVVSGSPVRLTQRLELAKAETSHLGVGSWRANRANLNDLGKVREEA